jgi:hypothetical protein
MPLKQKEIKKMVSRLQISILCLVETRVKKENFSRIVADMLGSAGILEDLLLILMIYTSK